MESEPHCKKILFEIRNHLKDIDSKISHLIDMSKIDRFSRKDDFEND